MSHDVFLSHSSKDKQVADAICAALEQAGIRVWMAPRDIKPGMSWAGSIVDAIESSSVMVIVFSENSNSSKQVIREIERAVQKDVVVVPYRIDRCTPTGDLEYFLSSTHWLDALTPQMDQHLSELTQIVRSLLKRDVGDSTLLPGDKAPALKPTSHTSNELHLDRREIDHRAAARSSPNPPAKKKGAHLKVLAMTIVALLIGLFVGSDSDFKEGVLDKFSKISFFGSSSTNDKITDEVEQAPHSALLSLCESHFAARRLTTGASGNALDCYKRVLEDSPTNLEALEGLEKIENTYAEWANDYILKGEVETAQTNLAKLRDLNPNHPSVKSLQQNIESYQQKIADQQDEADAAKRKIEEENQRLKDERAALQQAALEKQRAQDRERDRVADQERKKKLAELEHQRQLTQEAERRAALERAERNRIAMESEQRRLAAQAAEKRKAEEEARARQEKLNRERFAYGVWSGGGNDVSAGSFSTQVVLSENGSELSLSYPRMNSNCSYRLVPKSPLQEMKIGDSIRFDAKKVSGSCLNFRLRLTWTKTNVMDYKGFKLGIKYAGAELKR